MDLVDRVLWHKKQFKGAPAEPYPLYAYDIPEIISMVNKSNVLDVSMGCCYGCFMIQGVHCKLIIDRKSPEALALSRHMVDCLGIISELERVIQELFKGDGALHKPSDKFGIDTKH